MHDLLFEHQDALRPADLVGYADQLGLDVGRFKHHLREHTGAHRVAEDVEGADLSGVSGTPTFFINGRRHYALRPRRPLGRRPRGRRAGRLAATRTAERRPTARLALDHIVITVRRDLRCDRVRIRLRRPPPPGRGLQRVALLELVPILRRLRGRRGRTQAPGRPRRLASGGDRGGGAKRAPGPGRRGVPTSEKLAGGPGVGRPSLRRLQRRGRRARRSLQGPAAAADQPLPGPRGPGHRRTYAVGAERAYVGLKEAFTPGSRP